jgi:hypothetical protein
MQIYRNLDTGICVAVHLKQNIKTLHNFTCSKQDSGATNLPWEFSHSAVDLRKEDC